MSNEQERLAQVAAMYAELAARKAAAPDYTQVCQNCGTTLGEHKGSDFYCVEEIGRAHV